MAPQIASVVTGKMKKKMHLWSYDETTKPTLFKEVTGTASKIIIDRQPLGNTSYYLKNQSRSGHVLLQ